VIQIADPSLTQTCAFNAGPRAGQTVDFSGATGAAAVPVGSRCADMKGSSGRAVAAGIGPRRPGRFFTSPGAPGAWSSSGALKPNYTLTCRFNKGPRAGSSQDFTGSLGAEPLQIGSACSDGLNKGIAVPPGQ
jgi:hypothetical protein